MKKLQILRVDNDAVEKADLQIGNNIIGRSVVPGCDDVSTIKHAVTINVSPENQMTITPYQITPCYVKYTESSRWKLIKLGTTVPIKPGDVCSLVQDKCWFKIVLVTETMETSQEQMLKRKASQDIECNIPDKKHCSQAGEGDNAQVNNNITDDTFNNNNKKVFNAEINKDNTMNAENVAVENLEVNTESDTSVHDIKNESQNTIRSPTLDENVGELENYTMIEDVRNERNPSNSKKDHDNDNNAPVSDIKTSSNQSVGPAQADKPNTSSDVADVERREKCRYGEKCYRKNEQHKAEFSHPGDSDYDIPDDREECSYGTKCYRTSKQHKQQYKHTGSGSTGEREKQRRKESSKQVTSKDLLDLDFSGEESFEESIDESEYEQPTDFETSDEDESYSDKDESYSGKDENESEDDMID